MEGGPVSCDEAERMAWSIGCDAQSAADNAAAFAECKADLEAAIETLMRAVARIDRLANAGPELF